MFPVKSEGNQIVKSGSLTIIIIITVLLFIINIKFSVLDIFTSKLKHSAQSPTFKCHMHCRTVQGSINGEKVLGSHSWEKYIPFIFIFFFNKTKDHLLLFFGAN